MTISTILDQLESTYGNSAGPLTVDPWEMILSENVVYLADDEVRKSALQALRKDIGGHPKDVLAAPRSRLLRISSLGGILPDHCVDKVLRAAKIAHCEFGGDLRAVLKLPLPEARKALKKFPGIGDPGAEKILLFTGTHPFLSLESNGLRVLLRLGYGEEKKGYSATYRSVQEAVEGECPEGCPWRIRATLLLRRHGQETCKRSKPRCKECPLVRQCAYAIRFGEKGDVKRSTPPKESPRRAKKRR
jgi:endonuclease III